MSLESFGRCTTIHVDYLDDKQKQQDPGPNAHRALQIRTAESLRQTAVRTATGIQ